MRLRSPGGTLTLQDLYIHLEAMTESAGPEEAAATTEPQTTTRAATSLMPPGSNGTMIRTGLVG